MEKAQCLFNNLIQNSRQYQGEQQHSCLINKHCREIQLLLKASHGSGFLITSTTAPCSPSSFVPPTDFPIQWSSFHTACGPELGQPAWDSRGGTVAALWGTEVKQRRTRKSGNTEVRELSFWKWDNTRGWLYESVSFVAETVWRSGTGNFSSIHSQGLR